jgi:hypothetical protein
VIAVLGFDVHARVGEGARDRAKLAGNILLEAADQDRADDRGTEARLFERGAGSFAVLDQEWAWPTLLTVKTPPPSRLTPAAPSASLKQASDPGRPGSSMATSYKGLC